MVSIALSFSAASPALDARGVVRFLGLSDVVDIRDGAASFPPGTLYPYSGDLRRVCAAFGAVSASGDSSKVDALLASIATLHERIAFAPGSSAASVAVAYDAVRKSRGTGGASEQRSRR